ncbi:unnamed protein product, partial [Iphiclides podalirius]
MGVAGHLSVYDCVISDAAQHTPSAATLKFRPHLANHQSCQSDPAGLGVIPEKKPTRGSIMESRCCRVVDSAPYCDRTSAALGAERDGG